MTLNWSLILPSASDGGRLRSNAKCRTSPTRVSSSAPAMAAGFGHDVVHGGTSYPVEALWLASQRMGRRGTA